MKRFFVLFSGLMVSWAAASELVLTCDVGAKTTTRVEILRDSEIGDTHIYYVRQNGETHTFFNNPDGSRGSDVHAACVGKKHRAIVVSGAFTANFLQGFVLTRTSAIGKIERLDFAEKNPPEWLYLGADRTLIVLPTYGYGEISSKYVIYRHVSGAKTAAEPIGMDKLPAVGRFEVIKLKRSTAQE